MTSDTASMAPEIGPNVIGTSPHMSTRPPLLSYQSNSVPATPRQRARQFSNNGRSPSPTGAMGPHSPRSVSSEAPRNASGFRPTNPACRFQSTQTSRRRIPYTIGADVLDTVKEEPRQRLSDSEEMTLSADMKCLYDDLLPSQASQENRRKIVGKLRDILRDEWPERQVEVSVFGSSGNLLYTNKSDVDVCITMNDFDTVCSLAEVLSRRGMRSVTCVHAKAVPIVKIWDPDLHIACDLNVNNHVALKNTRLVRAYMEMDPRARPLAMIVKYWTKRRVINEASGGTLSSYTWTLLVIHFLQTRDVPVLPVLSLWDEQDRPKEDFSEELRQHRDFGKHNKETLGELFFQFFRRYGYEIHYETDVMSVRQGRLLTKQEKQWTLANNNRLCVEEPFNTDRNLGNTADDTAFRGLHIELRQAFTRLAEAQNLVASVCEQFEFPVEEHRSIFERPQPMPRPILSRSASQSGRGNRLGSNKRGNRQQFDLKSGANGRRSSSAAAFGHHAVQAFQNPQVLLPSNDFYLHQEELQRLSRQMSQEEQNLRIRQFQLLQTQQAMGVVPGRGPGSPLPTAQRPAFNNGYPSPRLSTNDANTGHATTASGYPFPAAYDSPVTMSHSSSQQGTSTNPNSPMLAPATPNRRGFQRNAALNSPGAAVRSQSQPARPLQPQLVAHSTLKPQLPQLVYPTMHGTGIWPTHLPRPAYYGPYVGPYGGYYMAVPNAQNLPREYLGYGIGSGPQFTQPPQDLSYSQTQILEESKRQDGQASPTRQSSSLSLSVADTPRSSSPLARGELQITGLRSAPINGTFGGYQHTQQTVRRPANDSEPIIVNGSYPAPSRSQPTQVDDIPELSGFSNSPSVSYAPSDNSVLDNGPFGSLHQASQSLADQGGLDVLPVQNDDTPIAENGPTSIVARQPEVSRKEPAIVRSSTEMPPPPWPATSIVNNRSPFAQPSQDAVNGSGRPGNSNKQAVPPLDLGNPAERIPNGVSTASTVLSPVQETRTPSPNNNKKHAARKSVQMNGIIVPTPPTPVPTKRERPESQIEAGIGSLGKKGSGPHVRSMSTANASASVSSMPGQWQQAGTGKKKGKKRNQSQSPGAEKKKGGEPLPANEAARKGG